MTTKTSRFLDLYHAGAVAPGEIDDYIDAWRAGRCNVQVHVYLGMTWAEYRTWLTDGFLPTAIEHAHERADAIWVGPDDERGFRLRVHPPAACRPPCPVHWPSDHPLAGAPLYWDAGQRYLLRICKHAMPHPDPDDQQVRLHAELQAHECDGCCRKRASLEGEFYEDYEPAADVIRGFDRAQERGITRRPQ